MSINSSDAGYWMSSMPVAITLTEGVSTEIYARASNGSGSDCAPIGTYLYQTTTTTTTTEETTTTTEETTTTTEETTTTTTIMGFLSPGDSCQESNECLYNNCSTYACGGFNASCSSNEQCAWGSYCNGNHCDYLLPPGGSCISNSECTYNNCSNYSCGGLNANCMSNEECATNNSLECVAGSCNTTTTGETTTTTTIMGFLSPGDSCQESYECLYNNCSNDSCGGIYASCSSNEQCAWGSYCNEGNCEYLISPGGSCISNSECTYNNCSNYSCGGLYANCMSNEECDTNNSLECVSGSCNTTTTTTTTTTTMGGGGWQIGYTCSGYHMDVSITSDESECYSLCDYYHLSCATIYEGICYCSDGGAIGGGWGSATNIP